FGLKARDEAGVRARDIEAIRLAAFLVVLISKRWALKTLQMVLGAGPRVYTIMSIVTIRSSLRPLSII
ncbi:MAG: hypothetical protein AAF085_01935, partial [Planctomycetota bacterium]